MEDALAALTLMCTILGTAAGFFAAAWWQSNKHSRRLEELLRSRLGNGERDDTIERSFAAIEEQLEHVREEQEFLSRLVAAPGAKALAPLSDQQPRALTPH